MLELWKDVHCLRKQRPVILLLRLLRRHAIWEADFPGDIQMTAQQFENEILFQASIAPFREMNRNGIITDEDLEKICTILTNQYAPIFGGIHYKTVARKVQLLLLICFLFI